MHFTNNKAHFALKLTFVLGETKNEAAFPRSDPCSGFTGQRLSHLRDRQPSGNSGNSKLLKEFTKV